MRGSVYIGPNNWIFLCFPDISWNGVLLNSFDPLNFFISTYIVRTIIFCVYIHFFSINSQASGRNKSPVILPTIIFVFLSTLSCKASPRALQLWKYSCFYSNLYHNTWLSFIFSMAWYHNPLKTHENIGGLGLYNRRHS